MTQILLIYTDQIRENPFYLRYPCAIKTTKSQHKLILLTFAVLRKLT